MKIATRFEFQPGRRLTEKTNNSGPNFTIKRAATAKGGYFEYAAIYIS